MRAKEFLKELFDPKLAVDLEWAEGSDYVAARGYVTVTNPDGYGGEYGNEEEVELEIEFGEYPHPQRKEYEVQFKVGESFAITGGGNANVIFATVIQACKDFVEMYKPDRLFFTADEQSRARMYDTITKRVAKQVGWHVLPFDEIQKDPLYRHKSGNGFMFVIAKGEAPAKFQSSQKPQHGSFMPIWFVYNLDKDTPTVAVKVRAPDRVTAVAHARKIEPSFTDLDPMQIHALSSLPKREVTDVIDGGTAGENQTVAEVSGKNVVKSVKVGNFRHDLVDTGMGWQVRIYNGDELYDTGMSKNSEQKGLSALEDAVAYTEKQTRTKRQGVAEDVGQPTFHVSSHDDFETAFEVEMVIDNNNPGFFSYQYFPETDDVENDVYIHSDQYRGQGFGKLLLLKAIETAQQHGLPFKPDRNGISPEQRRVYQSLLNDRLIKIGPDSTITLRGKPAVAENFADGRNPQDKGDSKRYGVPTKASVSTLRKIAKQGGRKGQLSHWMANMKAGKAKKND